MPTEKARNGRRLAPANAIVAASLLSSFAEGDTPVVELDKPSSVERTRWAAKPIGRGACFEDKIERFEHRQDAPDR